MRFERFLGDTLCDVEGTLRLGVLAPLQVSSTTPSKPKDCGAALRFRPLVAGDLSNPSAPGVVSPELSTVVA